MRAICIDDETLALESFARMLRKHDVYICGIFQDPRQALVAAETMTFDVAFVDIEMPGYNGLETAERLLALQPELAIVFVTAYDQYAIDAFELQAIDYVLKPVQPKRLEKTLQRLSRVEPKVQRPKPTGARPLLRFFHHMEFIGADGQRHDMPWRTAKAKEMFAYLVHVGETTVTKEALIDLLWPDLDDEKGQTNLHTTVYQIRRMLKSLEVPVILSYAEGGYRMETVGVESEVSRWERALQEGLTKPKPDLALAALRELLASYKGDYLEQEGYLWAENERQRLRMKWLNAALRAVEIAERAGQLTDVVALLTQVRERFPYTDDSYYRLMQVYDAMGLTAEVKQEYERLRRMQEEEIGMPPRPEIASWYAEWQKRR